MIKFISYISINQKIVVMYTNVCAPKRRSDGLNKSYIIYAHQYIQKNIFIVILYTITDKTLHKIELLILLRNICGIYFFLV